MPTTINYDGPMTKDEFEDAFVADHTEIGGTPWMDAVDDAQAWEDEQVFQDIASGELDF